MSRFPVTTTKGAFTGPVIRALASAGVIVNVTAIMTEQQVERVAECLAPNVPAIVSVFAGRVADTGRDPVPLMRACVRAACRPAEGGTALGQPARASQHLPGRRNRLPYHHRQPRRACQAVAGRQGPRRIFARDRENVPPRCHRGRLYHCDAGAPGGVADVSACDRQIQIIGDEEMPNKFSRVFVTGGAGYIGSVLVPQAARSRLQGHELRHFLLRRQFPAEEQSEPASHPWRHPRYGEARQGDRRPRRLHQPCLHLQ